MVKRSVKTMICWLTFILALYSLGNAATLVKNQEEPFSLRGDLTQAELERSMKMLQFSQSSFLAQETGPMTGQEDVDIYGFKGKSVKRAFAYSLLIPGSGEFYAGSKIKAVAFFGLDVALWALYFNYRGKGKDKEDDYREFADGHWSKDEYMQWLIDTFGIDTDTLSYGKDPDTGEDLYFSHHLPDSKTGQYYEMIGKYEQFSWGWTDYDGENSTYRGGYLDMRRESNDLLNKATYSAMFSLANHILSAFDAAITVRNYNKKGERFGQLEFKMRLVEREREIIPRITLSTKF
jgi:TM2 domain-containing membrane protein YozV